MTSEMFEGHSPIRSDKRTRKESAKIKGKEAGKRNRQLYVVMYLFVFLFLCMTGNFIRYIYFDSPQDVNSSYNTRQEKLAEKVIRGKILASDGQVLAETIEDENGKEKRVYPFGKTFAHVVGYTTRGQSGIEGLTNISLLTSNAQISERISNEISEIKTPGDNVVTTLDVKLQEAANEALGVYKGAIVCMDPKSGRILAMVSNPGFDPNTIDQTWEELNQQTATSPLLNRTTQGLYPPGSTFKIVTLMEYLKENDHPEEYSFECSGRYSFGGVTINCYHGSVHGTVDLNKSFAKSCNSSFANIGTKLNYRAFHKTADELMFNQKLPLKIPYKQSQFSLNPDSDTEEQLHTAIGQGKTLITPIHMAMITSAIANDGVMMRPILIDRIENYQGGLFKQYKEQPYKRVIDSKLAEDMQQYMENVVKEGTGSKLLNDIYTVAGKTGSAEYNDQKGESHSWFTGYCDVNDPKLVVTVIVEGAGSGSEYAVPMAKRIFDAYYQ